MAAADPIIHDGPLFGVPITESLPYLDRLERLMPEQADTRFHLAMVNAAVASADTAAASMKRAARVTGPPWGPAVRWSARLFESPAHGDPPLDSAAAMVRAMFTSAETFGPSLAIGGLLGLETQGAGLRLAVIDRLRAMGALTGDVALATTLGEGLLRSSRGDWSGALSALRRMEGSPIEFSERMTSARVAALGAWVGGVSAATADSVLRRVRALPESAATSLDKIELAWLDGLLGVTIGDESRVKLAQRALLADTTNTARFCFRSLEGLRLVHRNQEAGADTLRAVSEAAMRDGGFLMSTEAIDRLVIARALRRRGAPAEAERYLMWPDASTTSVPNLSVRLATGALVRYERGIALQEAGDKRAAAYQLQRFVDSYDQPPPAQRELVADAKRRLVELGKMDARKP
jgi:hypothetical protein